MFEEMTYEAILEDVLSRVASDVDKREGSIIYDALAPYAYKLAETYFQLNNFIDLFNCDTAVGEYLDQVVGDFGFIRKSATYACRKVETNGEIEIATRWSKNDTTYIVTELIATNEYKVQCEQPGIIGNQYFGLLESIDNVLGVTATLTDIISAGSDEENDEDLRKRFKEYITNPTQDGNVAQYKKWATAYTGIGTAKVFPLWNGGNTVKIAITNNAYLPADTQLVAEFQSYIDPNSDGLGNGVAPIGSKVTVTGGIQKDINISANVVLADGFTEAAGAAKVVSDYLASITYVKNSISYMRIGSALLDCESIAEISNLTINGVTTDIVLVGEEIPVLVNLNLVVTG